MRKALWFILVIAITLVVLIVLWQFSVSIVLFALSLAVASALKPVINSVSGRFRSRRLALGLVYSVVIGLIVVSAITVGQLLIQDLQKAADDLVIGYEYIKTGWPMEGAEFQETLSEQLPPSDDIFQALFSEEGMITLTEDSESGQEFFSSFGYIAIIIALSVYWSADQLRFERISISMFPEKHRAKALHIWRAIEKGVGAYLRSELIQSVLSGVILGAGYWMIGIRYPALLALWAAIVRLIPWFGILIAIIPLFLLGGGLTFSAIFAVIFTLLVLLILRQVIEAKMLDQHSNNPLIMIMFVILLAEAFGVIGVLLAPPLAVAVQIVLQKLYPLFARRYSQELKEALELKRRLSRVNKQIKNSKFPESSQLLGQLHRLVRQTISYIQKY